MKRIILLFILLSNLIFAVTLTGKVTSVYDGDTITIQDATGKHKIRFYGIDTPEVSPKQEFGIDARNYLNSMIYGKTVTVDVKDIDRYKRNVGEVFYNGKSMNLEMINSGWAWYYEQYAKERIDFKKAEQFARTNKKGVWKSNNPVAPWDFRRKN